MKPQIRKGLHDIVTYRGVTTDENNPQRKFLAAASVELKKTLCDRVRAAARKRVVEMDRKIAELDAELDSLVGRRQRRRAEGGEAADDSFCLADDQPQEQHGFTLKY